MVRRINGVRGVRKGQRDQMGQDTVFLPLDNDRSTRVYTYINVLIYKSACIYTRTDNQVLLSDFTQLPPNSGIAIGLFVMFFVSFLAAWYLQTCAEHFSLHSGKVSSQSEAWEVNC